MTVIIQLSMFTFFNKYIVCSAKPCSKQINVT
nr:MAG TPA: hypothetical protein [Caudoviricetes sp.]